ncbi:MAG: biopolymer transporter ExbD [Terriglobia bacterium]
MPLKGKSPPEVSSINVTPLCDVMLVLLIIFMVITPLLQNKVTVDMAKALNTQDMDAARKSNAVVIAITRDGKLYLGSDKVTLDSLPTDITNKLAHNLDKTVYIKADARAKYGDVVGVFSAVQTADVQDVGLLTEQIQRKPGYPPQAALTQ